MATITFNCTKDASTVKYISGGVANGYWSTSGELHLPVGRFDIAGGDDLKARSFVYFPVDFTNIENIDSAIMHVRARSENSWHCRATTTFTVYASRMTSDWGEGQSGSEAVWPSGQAWNWNNRADAYTTAGQASWTGTRSDAFKTWDVTSIVQAWKDGSPNYGIQLRAADEVNQNEANDFYDRAKGTAYRAYLVITYSSNTAPNAPTSLSPTGSAVINSLTPTFSGTRSDPDAGDYVKAYQIQVGRDITDPATGLILWDSGQVSTTGTPTTFSRAFGQGGTLNENLTGNLHYKWRARTWDKASDAGPWSSWQRFKVNTVPATPSVAIVETPINDLLTVSPTVRVTHNDADATDDKMHGYRIIVTTAAGAAHWDTGDIDISSAPLATVSAVIPTLAWGTSYIVKARTKDSNGAWSSYSADLAFATHAAGVPINLDPTASEVIPGLVPMFQGARASSADSITHFQIQLYQNDGTTLIWDSGTTAHNIPGTFSKLYNGPALSYGTPYRWRARITSSVGGVSQWSAMQLFSTAADANVPTQSAPIGVDINTLTPTFTGTRTSSNFNAFQIQTYPSTATEANLGTPINDTGTVAQAAATSFSRVYNGAALAWATTYKWRVRVSSDGGTAWSNWSGLAQFSTLAAGMAVLTSPTSTTNYWQTTATPALAISRAGTDTIALANVQVYNSSGSTLVWDSGWVDVVDGTTASITYAGPTLAPGTVYSWRARYQVPSGPIGAWSALASFRVNAPPSIPTQLSPEPGHVFSGTLLPTFKATFSDPDTAAMGDFPTKWEIEIRNNTTDDLIVNREVLNVATTEDTFPRTIASGWGTPDVGPNWINASGTTGNTSVSGGFGRINHATNNQSNVLTSDVNHRHIYATGRMRISKVPTGGDAFADIALRYVDANNFYYFQLFAYNNGVLKLEVSKKVAGVHTTLTNVTLATSGYANVFYNFRYEALGINPTTLNAKVWADGEAEPSDWTVTVTDSSAALQVTADARVNATTGAITNVPIAYEFDNIVIGNANVRPASTGINEYTWTEDDTLMSTSILYKWRTRFTDSRGVAGAWSGYQVMGFGNPPVGTITSPTNGSNINSVRPTIAWTYTHADGKAQLRFRIQVFRLDTLIRIYDVVQISSATSYQLPAGFLQNGKDYRIKLTVVDTDEVEDESASEVDVTVNLDAPNPVEGLSPTIDEEYSRIILEWNQSSLKPGHTFLSYRVYRKMVNDVEWTHVASLTPISNTMYTDWYAGQGVSYDYRVTVVTRSATSGIELESVDDPAGGNQANAALESDVWMVVGRGFQEEYIQELPVSDESHESVVQQETFEVLGGRRKVVIRGAVLGDEGSLTMHYDAREVEWPINSGRFYDYTVVGRRLLDFLLNTPGPHILKSPFGDIWMVEFQGPSKRFVGGGHMEVTIEWIEISRNRSTDTSVTEELYD